jgi:hypothetical protein
MKMKFKSNIRAAGHSFGGLVCVGAVLLIAFSAPAQNLLVANNDASMVLKFTSSGAQSVFASGLNPQGLAVNSAGNSPAAVTGNGGISANELTVPNKARVISRLEKVGYSKEEAIARVEKMTDDEIVYFAGHPESIKRSGFILIASSIGSSIYSTIKSSQNKKKAEIQKKKEQITNIKMDVSSKENERNMDLVLAQNEHDPAKSQMLQTKIGILNDDIKSLRDQIQSLENEIDALENPKAHKNDTARPKK